MNRFLIAFFAALSISAAAPAELSCDLAGYKAPTASKLRCMPRRSK